MIWQSLFLIFLASTVHAIDCDNSMLVYDFTFCIKNTRKVIFHWKSNTCTNALPGNIEQVPCDITCGQGEHLGVDVSTRSVKCMPCPSNTYSTGSALRFSSIDKNWDVLPKESLQLKQGYWQSELCNSFEPDSSAFKVNMKAVHPNTWNLLEFKLSLYLIEDGKVEFAYRKTSKIALGMNNGKMRFDVGFRNFLHDEDPSSYGKNFTMALKKGYNELMWYFVVNTAANSKYDELFAEITRIEVTPISYAPTYCTACNGTYSSAGASYCTGCPANFFLPTSGESCTPCPDGTVAYPGENVCSHRPECKEEYDTEKIRGECINKKRTVTFKWKENVICNKAESTLPGSRVEDCSKCPKGSYINGGECVECPEGTFSDKENSVTCKKCPAGKFAIPVIKYENIETVPEGFINQCEVVQDEAKDPCYFHSGWIVANGSFTAHPSLPKGTRLVLRKVVNITQNFGALRFVYKVPSYKSAESSEQLKIHVNGIATTAPLNELEDTFSVALPQGEHKIEWVYEKLLDVTTLMPLSISSIRIEGSNGPSDFCAVCPAGFYIPANGSACSLCEAGYEPNVEQTACETCKEGYYKGFEQLSCEQCPTHTHSTESRTKCVLYDSYNINGEYSLNMQKFDSSRDLTILDLRDASQDGSFFGPFIAGDSSDMFFISLVNPIEYNVEKYEYEEEANSIPEGHIFALFPGEQVNSGHVMDTKDEMRRAHYRVKKNLGSRLKATDFSKATSGEVTLEYTEGDVCETGRHEAKIKLICDKSVPSLAKLQYLPLNSTSNSSLYKNIECMHSFVWKTPYACSQCRLNETIKYYGMCHNGQRSVFLEEGKNCILHTPSSPLLAESILFSATNNTMIVNITKSIINATSTANITEGDFVYYEEYTETCNELALSYAAIFIVIGVLIIAIIIAVFAIILTLRYKKRYYQLLDGKTDTREIKQATDPGMSSVENNNKI